MFGHQQHSSETPAYSVSVSSHPHQLKKKRCQSWTPSDKIFWIAHESVQRFGSISGPALCWAWSGSKLLAKIISRRQKWPMTDGELKMGQLMNVWYLSRPPDKTAHWIYFCFSQPKYMFWVLNETVLLAPKTHIEAVLFSTQSTSLNRWVRQ